MLFASLSQIDLHCHMSHSTINQTVSNPPALPLAAAAISVASITVTSCPSRVK
eukprot:m.98876 g.98876  ORF g.98876 m.98876 type:complete len:53 (+) comp13128_c0_seq8:1270-1428(+)